MLLRRVARTVAHRRAYHERVIDHYANPRNAGSFKKEEEGDSVIGTAIVGAPACGDVMKLQIKMSADGKTIVDSRFKTYGCGSAIASSSLATEMVKNKTLEDAEGIKNTDLAKHLDLPLVKLHCSMLAESAIQKAVGDVREKLRQKTETKEAKKEEAKPE
ncbi:MAG: iron-binding protein [Cercozoa sp. M6MM]